MLNAKIFGFAVILSSVTLFNSVPSYAIITGNSASICGTDSEGMSQNNDKNNFQLLSS